MATDYRFLAIRQGHDGPSLMIVVGKSERVVAIPLATFQLHRLLVDAAKLAEQEAANR